MGGNVAIGHKNIFNYGSIKVVGRGHMLKRFGMLDMHIRAKYTCVLDPPITSFTFW